MKNYEVIWIGTGQATGTILPRLTRARKKVALAEGGRFGGSCVNYGCTPTKTIVASARAAHMARRGPEFGVMTGDFTIDFAKVMERQNQMRHGTSHSFEDWLRGMRNLDIYDEFATFTSPNTVRVGSEVIRADTIVINAGGRPRVLPIDGLDEVDWLNNIGLLNLKELPDHLVIVGGSYIGLEFAQAFRRFGSRVTILERSPQIMFREDEDIATIAQEVLEEEGVAFELNAGVKRVRQDVPNKIEVFFEQDGRERWVAGSHLLMAVGRIPNSDRLNLEAAGVQTDQKGYIQVNDYMQTNIPHIYAVGDINGEGAFTHTSVNDGEIFWDFYADDPDDRKLSERVPTYAVFIDPPLTPDGPGRRHDQHGRRQYGRYAPITDL